MISDKKIDLTEDSVFGIREFIKANTVQIPWLLDEYDHHTSTGERASDALNQWIDIGYTISSQTETATTFTYHTNINDDLNWGTNNAYSRTWLNSGTSSYTTITSTTSTGTSIYKFYNSSYDGINARPKLDAFGFPIIEEERSTGRGADDMSICYQCGGLVAGRLWGSRESTCPACARKLFHRKFKKDDIWGEEQTHFRSRRRDYDDDPIPWEIEASKEEADRERREREEWLSDHERFLRQIPWLKDRKSYFGVGGRVDWPSIEDDWNMRLLDLGLLESDDESKKPGSFSINTDGLLFRSYGLTISRIDEETQIVSNLVEMA